MEGKLTGKLGEHEFVFVFQNDLLAACKQGVVSDDSVVGPWLEVLRVAVIDWIWRLEVGRIVLHFC